MRAFTYDVESVELDKAEYVSFALIVRSLCYLVEQHKVSVDLSWNREPQGGVAQETAQRQARRMWRTEARL
jgi:hypothetical protein